MKNLLGIALLMTAVACVGTTETNGSDQGMQSNLEEASSALTAVDVVKCTIDGNECENTSAQIGMSFICNGNTEETCEMPTNKRVSQCVCTTFGNQGSWCAASVATGCNWRGNGKGDFVCQPDLVSSNCLLTAVAAQRPL
jgi:hypothetical protein